VPIQAFGKGRSSTTADPIPALQKRIEQTKLYHILAKAKPTELGFKMGHLNDNSKVTNQQDNLLFLNNEHLRKRLLS